MNTLYYMELENHDVLFNSLNKHETKHELVKFLSSHGTNYDKLIKTIHKLEEKYSTIEIPNVWESLLIDKKNVYNCVTEIPTTELINVISCMAVVCDVEHIYELDARSGLLSLFLKKHIHNEYKRHDIMISTMKNSNNGLFLNSIGKHVASMESSPKYIKLVKHAVYHMYDNKLDTKTDYSRVMLVVNWSGNSKLHKIKDLIQKTMVPITIILGDMYRNICKEFVTDMTSLEYDYYHLPVKQISWADYFYKNNHYSKNTAASMMSIIINKNIINKDSLMTMFDNSVIDKRPKKLSIRQIAQDIMMQRKIPQWIVSLEHKQFMNMMQMYTMMMHNGFNGYVPLWIDNVKSYTFWYLSWMNKLLPKQLITYDPDKQNNHHDIFENYMKHVCGLQIHGLEHYKKQGIIKDYIGTLGEAEKFILLDASTSNKQWKENRKTFIIQFNKFWKRRNDN